MASNRTVISSWVTSQKGKADRLFWPYHFVCPLGDQDQLSGIAAHGESQPWPSMGLLVRPIYRLHDPEIRLSFLCGRREFSVPARCRATRQLPGEKSGSWPESAPIMAGMVPASHTSSGFRGRPVSGLCGDDCQIITQLK